MNSFLAAEQTCELNGSIALIERGGGCGFFEKCLLAQQRGAGGCVVYNAPAEDGVTRGTLGETGSQITIPSIGTTRAAGLALAQYATDDETIFELNVVTDVRTVMCSNIIATTTSGDPDSIVVIGSHMDGVAAGPGINDNGSGCVCPTFSTRWRDRYGLFPCNRRFRKHA